MTNLAPPVPFGGLIAEGAAADTAPAALIGICDATQSTYQDRCALAPPAIRRAYDGASFNTWSESFTDCAGAVADRGDLHPDPGGFRASAVSYRDAVRAELDRGIVPFILGGDHAITPALVAAWAGRGPIHVVQWDAHPDMHPHYGGNPDSHACVAARLLEQDHVAGITQIGIRTETGWQLEVRRAAGGRVRQIPAWEAESGGPFLDHLPEDARIYVTFDLDGFDPAFAPAVAHRMIMQDPATPAAGVLEEILDTVPVDGRRPAPRGALDGGRPEPVAATS